ncbi:MAG: hypothetical protein Q9169_005242 [Polycauliona sp. 2 TL-2023]
MSKFEKPSESKLGSAKRASFESWSTAHGITTNGIDYCEIPNQGLGIVARRRLNAGEELVNVPFSALVTINSVPPAFRKKHRQITTQGLLASFLASGDVEKSTYAPWAATWPSLADFRDAMPICWRQRDMTSLTEDLLDETTSHHHDDLLSPAAIDQPSTNALDEWLRVNPHMGLIQKQRKKLKADWKIVGKALPSMSFEKYVHYWLLVNTRTFYFEMPNVKNHPSRNDRIVMCPFIDLFNHNDSGCNVHYAPTGYTVTTDKVYDAGDEVYVSYGRHTNDFLLVEYGFVLASNRWDSTPIDHYLMAHLVKTPLEEQLQRADYIGGYFLDYDGVCHRTQVALQAQILPEHLWNDFVAGRSVDTVEGEHGTQTLVANQVLVPYLQEAEDALERLQTSCKTSASTSHNSNRILIQRWKQIRALLQRALAIAGQ